MPNKSQRSEPPHTMQSGTAAYIQYSARQTAQGRDATNPDTPRAAPAPTSHPQQRLKRHNCPPPSSLSHDWGPAIRVKEVNSTPSRAHYSHRALCPPDDSCSPSDTNLYSRTRVDGLARLEVSVQNCRGCSSTLRCECQERLEIV